VGVDTDSASVGPRPKALLLSPLPEELLGRIARRCDVVRLDPPAEPAELLASLADADGLLLTNRTRVDGALLEQARHLKIISNIGVGLDHVDLRAAERLGISVQTTPVVSDAVADLVIALAIMLSRRLGEAMRSATQEKWRQPRLGNDLKGKTLFLVGFGRIGVAVAHRALAFGMNVCFYDTDPGAGMDGTLRARDLAAGLRQADFVSLHVDLNERTLHLIGAAELACMKPTAYLINTARGAVVDQRALTEALARGAIAGAGLDVLEEEPPRADEPLLVEPNAIVVPHIGTATEETRREMRIVAVENLLAGIGAAAGPR
jgi:lactate dehydrogenase-like 2-hydroxyacid dehydrogenase